MIVVVCFLIPFIAGVIVHAGDVCSQQMLEHLFEKHDFTTVIHLAGKEGAANSMSNPIGYITANTECLMTLLEVFKEHKVSLYYKRQDIMQLFLNPCFITAHSPRVCFILCCVW